MSDDFIEKLWAEIEERQESINRQLSESERKFILRQEENKRIIEVSERKFFQRIDERNLAIKDLDQKILKKLEENRPKTESAEEQDDVKTGKSSKRKRKKNKCDIVIEVTFNAEQKQNKDIFISHIYRLKAALQDAGYKIIDQEDNIIRINS